MAVDLTLFDTVQSELVATLDYDTIRDISKARRHVHALRRMLHFASASKENGREIEFSPSEIRLQLDQALAFIRAHESVSEADRLANPDVSHADFSTFGHYRGGRNLPEGASLP